MRIETAETFAVDWAKTFGLTSLIAAMLIPALAAPVPVPSAGQSANPVMQAQYYYYEHHRYHHRHWDEHFHHWHYYG